MLVCSVNSCATAATAAAGAPTADTSFKRAFSARRAASSLPLTSPANAVQASSVMPVAQAAPKTAAADLLRSRRVKNVVITPAGVAATAVVVQLLGQSLTVRGY